MRKIPVHSSIVQTIEKEGPLTKGDTKKLKNWFRTLSKEDFDRLFEALKPSIKNVI